MSIKDDLINQFSSLQAEVGVLLTLKSKLLSAKKYIKDNDLKQENETLLPDVDETEKVLYQLLPKLKEIADGKIPSYQNLFALLQQTYKFRQDMNSDITKVSEHIKKVETRYNVKIEIEKFENKIVNIGLIILIGITALIVSPIVFKKK